MLCYSTTAKVFKFIKENHDNINYFFVFSHGNLYMIVFYTEVYLGPEWLKRNIKLIFVTLSCYITIYLN